MMDPTYDPGWPKATDEEVDARHREAVRARRAKFSKLKRAEPKNLPTWAQLTPEDLDAREGPLPPTAVELREWIRTRRLAERQAALEAEARLFRAGFLSVLQEWLDGFVDNVITVDVDIPQLKEDDIIVFQQLVEKHGFYIDSLNSDD